MATPLRPIPIKGKTILIVEDDLGTRHMLSLFLENQGYSIQSVADVESTLSILAYEKFDLIITNINIPHMNGIELIRKVRLRLRVSKPPILAMTALGDETLNA